MNNDSDIHFAIFNDTQEITEAVYQEVKSFHAFLAQHIADEDIPTTEN